MKNVLVTGADGFIGRNLIASLRILGDLEILRFEAQNTSEELQAMVNAADFVFHLAGVNRPQELDEFDRGNRGLTEQLVDCLRASDRKTPVLLSSSIQADLDNPYGRSKRSAEEAVLRYNEDTGAEVFIYRLTNVFGKWCRPNYNSVVATFCHNIANGLPITISDPDATINLVYIDDVVSEFVRQMRGGFEPALPSPRSSVPEHWVVRPGYPVKLGIIASLLYSFQAGRESLSVPDLADEFAKKLYSTYLSYLPEDGFSYPLKMNTDARGSFTEFIKTPDRGQVSVNIAKAGITKGNHWHHTKSEKFLVVSGKGVIRFRRIDSPKVLEYFVSGNKLEVVDIPPGYTHNIENLGDTDMVTIMWANEPFDPDKPDTMFAGV
ncbi:NAD dependent epimerase/dehydratase family [Acididesulfobacillus acetoxydans]|uniref:NAD dependent epimerase/dehydratase family n=1 Tax=Acididesulfobacillus acetoxydans TaxID=1561005 RepID=A0A8S0WI76_9FIRM|nr:NAD-dependent epimerase/dehydratase family protein [Acididesulfobacillus acetoxydans]CAA7603152.1 NAD dependent epimerase/dehydratase family [Acididesulfobacillus acetoxydans]CEJ07620.1 NAD-dependent epimerase/dehydratase [Acididesulfobacillus acetoxydans]